jgi:hypothetical protein
LNGGNLDSEGEFKIAQKLAETCIASKWGILLYGEYFLLQMLFSGFSAAVPQFQRRWRSTSEKNKQTISAQLEIPVRDCTSLGGIHPSGHLPFIQPFPLSHKTSWKFPACRIELSHFFGQAITISKMFVYENPNFKENGAVAAKNVLRLPNRRYLCEIVLPWVVFILEHLLRILPFPLSVITQNIIPPNRLFREQPLLHCFKNNCVQWKNRFVSGFTSVVRIRTALVS